uniref:E3 UFM1-protein ligase 1 homolog n=1 Tax=Corethrella appendiculata TaxID=1370023 RepID=U5EZ64_9DIPT
MSSNWDEIKRLAADFQKAQLSSSLQRLSERNCVEVVTLLIEKGLLNVIYTSDGKEYLTPDHLENEIRDELYVRGGRVNLVELSRDLNVDFDKIVTVAEKIIVEDKQITFLLGQLIDKLYIQRIAAEINEKLGQLGEINVSDLTIQYDLPAEFILENVMLRYLNSIIFGKQDPTNRNIFFTQSYIVRCRSKLRGALVGITSPTSISTIFVQSSLQERMLNLLLNDFNAYGTLTTRTMTGLYIPHVFTKAKNEWVQSFYKQNGYLEHDALVQFGVSDVKNFLQNQFPNEKFYNLKKCSVGTKLVDQVQASLDECIASNSYLDISTVLPSVFSDDDVDQILTMLLTPATRKQTLLFGTTVLTTKYLDEIVKPCYVIVDENAKKSIENGSYQQYYAEKLIKSQPDLDTKGGFEDTKIDKRDERRKKAAGGKAGGGAQGRETKTKSTKKHSRGQRGNQSDSDDDFASTNVSSGNKKKGGDGGKKATIDLISTKDIRGVLEKALEAEGLDDLSSELAQYFHPQFTKIALAKAQELYELSLQSNKNRKQTHATIQDKLNNIYNDIRLYEKGLKLLPSDLQPQLIKYLLKTIGTDFCNEIFLYVAIESNLPYNTPSLTIEQRNKIMQECDSEYKSALQTLQKSLTSQIIDEFLTVAENSLQACSMILKKIDKKKDRNLILSHKHGLIEQLTNCKDPALVLHLSVLIMFTVVTQNMLHASGRNVSAILSFLQPSLSPDETQLLTNYHDLVLKLLSSESQSEGDSEVVQHQLDELTPKIKEISFAISQF